MKYDTASAFLMALKSHLHTQAQELGVSTQRLQKEAVFERLMARLLIVAPGRWVLKGGVALDFRYIPEARATRDLDLAWLGTEEEATNDLIAVQSVDLGDHFTFAIERKELAEWTGTRSASYHVDVEIAGHHYTSVVVDVGFDDAVGTTPEVVRAPDFLGFAGIEPIAIPTLPLQYHIAEKVHAYTRRYTSGPSSRPKDLVDLLVISFHEGIDARPLREALHQTFGIRDTHPLPANLPAPPGDWSAPYGRLAHEVHIPMGLREGHERVAAFLDPLLAGTLPDIARWDPKAQEWIA
jgi:predicted nucleotidyltransferase component of viral defense system